MTSLKEYSETVELLANLLKYTCISQQKLIDIINDLELPKKFKCFLISNICRKNAISFLMYISVQLNELSKLPEQTSKNFIYSNSDISIAITLFLSILNLFFGETENKNLPMNKLSGIKLNSDFIFDFYENYNSKINYSSKTFSALGQKAKLRVKNISAFQSNVDNYNKNISTIQYADTTSTVTQYWTDIGKNWTNQYPTNVELELLGINNNGTVRTAVCRTSPTMYNYLNNVWVQNQSFKNINPSDSVWNRFAMSDNGEYQIIAGKTGICLSNDSGINWTKILNGVYDACSISGQYLLVSQSGGTLLRSNDYGSNFTTVSYIASIYTGMSLSSDGKIQVACSNQGIVISYDSGDTWIFYDFHAETICVSSDGLHLTYSIDNRIYISQFVNGAFFNNLYSVFNGTGKFVNLSMSSAGQYQVAVDSYGKYFISTNYGNVWFYNQTINFNNVVINGSGEYLLASNTSIYESKATSIPTPIYPDKTWRYAAGPTNYNNKNITLDHLTSSNPGNIITAAGLDIPLVCFYYSTMVETIFMQDDYFITEQNRGIQRMASDLSGNFTCFATYDGAFYKFPSSNWTKVSDGTFDSVAVSGSGQYILFAAKNGEYLLFSDDHGQTFNKILESTDFGKYYDLAISSDGKIQIAPCYIGVNISYDYGESWNTYKWGLDISTVAISSDGKYVTFGCFYYGIAITKLGEDGFYQLPTIVFKDDLYMRFWEATMDLTGQKQVMKTVENRYYVSQDYGRTWSLLADTEFTGMIINPEGDMLISSNISLYNLEDPGNTMSVTDVVPTIELEQISSTEIQTFSFGNILLDINSVQTSTQLSDLVDNNFQYFEFKNSNDEKQYFEITTSL